MITVQWYNDKCHLEHPATCQTELNNLTAISADHKGDLKLLFTLYHKLCKIVVVSVNGGKEGGKYLYRYYLNDYIF